MRKVSRADEINDLNFRTAGAWPSEVDHDLHISNMEELADHHAKGVAWHSKRGDMIQAGRHGAALAALTGAIEACKRAKQ